MKKTVVAVALVAPVLLGVSACSTAKGQVKGTFPYCTYQPTEDGVFVPEDNPRQCVVDDTREADDRAGYKGGHTVIVPRGTSTATRTPLPVPSTKTPAPTTKATKAATTKSVKRA